ncbi:MAG: hypothetical protein IJV37_00085 [Bacteroidales bacterium]|nr:hypothetical protein [Bacteroidales bacterium]
MSDQPKKKAMDLDGDGKVTLDEVKQYTQAKAEALADKVQEKFDQFNEKHGDKIEKLEKGAAAVAGKAKAKAAELSEEVKDLYEETRDKLRQKR